MKNEKGKRTLNVEIKVTGPAYVIANEVYYLEKVLRDNGYEVSVIDKHPPTKTFNPLDIDGSKRRVIVIANHIPWGKQN